LDERHRRTCSASASVFFGSSPTPGCLDFLVHVDKNNTVAKTLEGKHNIENVGPEFGHLQNMFILGPVAQKVSHRWFGLDERVIPSSPRFPDPLGNITPLQIDPNLETQSIVWFALLCFGGSSALGTRFWTPVAAGHGSGQVASSA
jgi:hypothetical protein